jgi:hypothetical protein
MNELFIFIFSMINQEDSETGGRVLAVVAHGAD